MSLAYEIHQSAPNDAIEFIISSFEDGKLQIDSIKEGGICEDCPSAWIGSQVAFSAFQEERLNTYPKGILFSLMLPMVIMQNENGAWNRCY